MCHATATQSPYPSSELAFIAQLPLSAFIRRVDLSTNPSEIHISIARMGCSLGPILVRRRDSQSE